MMSEQAAHCLIEVAASAIQSSPKAFPEVLDNLAAPIYLTDSEGTHLLQQCVRQPRRKDPWVGTDKWCVTWKLYRTDGSIFPMTYARWRCHPREAIHSRRGGHRRATDGTRINFIPHPTPLFDEDGTRRRRQPPAGRHGTAHARTPQCARPRLRRRTADGGDRNARSTVSPHCGQGSDEQATIKLGDVVALTI